LVIAMFLTFVESSSTEKKMNGEKKEQIGNLKAKELFFYFTNGSITAD